MDKLTKKVPTMIEVHGQPRKMRRLPPYREKPTIPAFCPAQPTTGAWAW
jgi:hypothetical protein